MTELAKCRCGATARITADFAVARDPDVPESAFGPRHLIPVPDGHYEIECPGDCGVYVWARTVEEATARWNDLMRPRPTATKGSGRVCLGSTSIRIGFVGDDGDDDWIAQCTIDGWHVHCYSEDDAMAELVEHLRGLGFDVKEVSGG